MPARPGPTWDSKRPAISAKSGSIRTIPTWSTWLLLGHAFGPNPERGVYRSKDGGRTWEQVLYRSPKAGAVDLAMDPNNPRLLYASIWETCRNFWSLSSGGPDSGLFKSTDGGDTWTEISDKQGLPKGIKGKIGVAVSPAQSDRVWAIMWNRSRKASTGRMTADRSGSGSATTAT